MRRRVIGWLLAGMLGVPSAARAQQGAADDGSRDQDPRDRAVHEQVIVTGTAAPVAFDALARQVVVVTRAEIERLPVRSIADVLRLTSSVDVRARGPFGTQTDFAIRGATFAQTLVLVNGIRLNDAQSGHHNADFPVPLDEVERVEILLGPGSSLYGADAFGGTINIITRTAAASPGGRVTGPVSGYLIAGGHDLVQAGAGATVAGDALTARLSVAHDRSDGFMAARDFANTTARLELGLGTRTRLSVGHAGKEFGAADFYGPAPSREWTQQTLVDVAHDLRSGRPWHVTAQGFYRTHGDRFLYDVRQPDRFENRHRTHAVGGVLRAHHRAEGGRRVSVGVESGADWIASTGLGDHAYQHGALFAEVQQPAGAFLLYSALRVETYSDVGHAWSPSLAITRLIAHNLKWRASAGHAFRVPTFTERYYTDPNHEASADLAPEQAWSVETGLDYLASGGWLLSGTVFARRERDVIDWVRASERERWRTTNIHRLDSAGIEAAARWPVVSRISGGLQYAWLHSRADELPLLSKYALDHARHAMTVWTSMDLGHGISVGQSTAYTRRAESRYWVTDLRVTALVRTLRVFVEGANLFDARYEEIGGVRMPGRWIRGGIAVGWNSNDASDVSR